MALNHDVPGNGERTYPTDREKPISARIKRSCPVFKEGFDLLRPPPFAEVGQTANWDLQRPHSWPGRA
jgi:hypothetical protein